MSWVESSLAIYIRSFKVYLVILLSNPSIIQTSGPFSGIKAETSNTETPTNGEPQSRNQDSKTIIRTFPLPNVGILNFFLEGGGCCQAGGREF